MSIGISARHAARPIRPRKGEYFESCNCDMLCPCVVTGVAARPTQSLKMLGVEARPIHFGSDGLRRPVSVPGLLEQATEGAPGAIATEPIYLANVGHPANIRLGLAHATDSHCHAFGMNWDHAGGRNNGHLAPFNRQVQ
ncbi:MAG TPA: DUF1326 domain-containing protein [Anaerolineae bacterium]